MASPSTAKRRIRLPFKRVRHVTGSAETRRSLIPRSPVRVGPGALAALTAFVSLSTDRAGHRLFIGMTTAPSSRSANSSRADDPTPCVDGPPSAAAVQTDLRSQPQRNHDALNTRCEILHCWLARRRAWAGRAVPTASQLSKGSCSRYFVPKIRSCRAVSPKLTAFTTLPLL